jgi:5'-3' exonuclease
MKVHVVDGTYELFRAWFGAPRAQAGGLEVGAARGILSTLSLLLRQPDVTHVGVAFDHVIESFRNRLFAGYKTGLGLDPDLLGQFQLAEDAARALGLVVWPMVEYEADDALATAAARFADMPEVEQVVICSPDKDLAQCVRGQRVVRLDRRQAITLDEDGVRAKFGVGPSLIPDFLALVGDSADGYPGLPRWGERSAAAVLSRYGSIDAIPLKGPWDSSVRGAAALQEVLRNRFEDALLYRRLATLVTDVPLGEDLEAMRWRGASKEAMEALCARIDAPGLLERVPRWAERHLPSG